MAAYFDVADQILPWNYPLLLLAWKAGAALAALAAGFTVVVKPVEQAPLAVIRAVQLSTGALPDGVVTGYGEEAGAPLTERDGVGKLSLPVRWRSARKSRDRPPTP